MEIRMKLVVFFFAVAAVFTAIFSYSLQFYLQDNFIVHTFKTMLIPCFTWIVLIILADQKLTAGPRMTYLAMCGLISVAGSAILVPAGVYNYIAGQPYILVSAISVLVSVVIMSILFQFLLRRNSLSLKWWWYFNVLICINMLLFYLSIPL